MNSNMSIHLDTRRRKLQMNTAVNNILAIAMEITTPMS